MSADNEFTLWINGKKVSEGSNFKTPVKSPIASFLRPGANVVSVAVNNVGTTASPADGSVLLRSTTETEPKPS